VSKSDLFAYLAAFVSIILAIALTDMIQSMHRLLKARDRVRWDPLILLLALTVFILVLGQFFGLWGDARFKTLTFNGLLALIAVPTVYTFAAFAVLPDEVPANGLDLRQYYFDNRRYLAVLLALGTAGDLIRNVRWGIINDLLMRADFLILSAMSFGGGFIALAVIYRSRSWRANLIAILVQLIVIYIPSSLSRIEPTEQAG
jgi:hypothetical protein